MSDAQREDHPQTRAFLDTLRSRFTHSTYPHAWRSDGEDLAMTSSSDVHRMLADVRPDELGILVGGDDLAGSSVPGAPDRILRRRDDRE